MGKWLEDRDVAEAFQFRVCQLLKVPQVEMKGAQLLVPTTSVKLASMFIVRRGEAGFQERRLIDADTVAVAYIAVRVDSHRLWGTEQAVQDILQRNASQVSWLLNMPLSVFNASSTVGL